MDKHQKTGPAQPDEIERPREDSRPSQSRDQQKTGERSEPDRESNGPRSVSSHGDSDN
ncbi:MAG: hypothetical protein RLW68_14170 [Devosia marina]|uniref:hypothetical protein n=1 Tax=Devosia marina TaxID=2683198 RepID=UPI0032F0074B